MGYSAAQGAVISVSVDGVAASQRQIEGLTQSMGKLSDTVQGAIRNLAATTGLGGGAAAVIQLSDQYSKLTSQLRLATDSTSAYATAYGQVKRISAEAQADLTSTGVLYARIANGTRELGISQQRVGAITEVVNLALKVSAATTEEAASAQLQLSQAFASGALRGEEFNAVNEAAPRLMKALADGMGVPVGALKQMASEGKITSEVLAEVLPKSLEQLRQEATQVQTIGGAFTNLKNQVLEFTAVNAQSNGTVGLMTGSINLLADNLRLVAGALTTVTAVKAATWAQSWITETYKKIVADQAARTATLAAAQATVAAAEADLARVQATGAQAVATQAAVVIAREEMTARLGQANANIAAAEAAIAASTAAGAQSFAMRTLRLATAELAAAETARSAALAELAVLGQQQVRVSAQIAAARVAEATATRAVAVAQEGAVVGAGLASRALGLLGGPVGAVITVLGIAATAWSVYGSKAEDANKQAAESSASSTPEIVANLEKQNEKLRERLALMKAGPPTLAKDNGPDAQQLASILTQINGLVAKGNKLKEEGKQLDQADQAQLYALGLQYSNLTQAMETNKGLKAEVDANGTALTNLIAVRERLTGVNKQYLEDLSTLQTALEKGAIGQKEYISLVSQLATEEYKKSETGKAAIEAANKEKEAYATLITAIRAKTDENRVELKVGENAAESQKMAVKLDEELASGKLKLSAAHLAVARAALVALGITERQLKQQDAERDLAKWITASTDARAASAASLQVEYDLYGQSNDARDLAMVKVRAEAEGLKKLDDMIAAHKPVSDKMLADLEAEVAARVRVEQATLAQSKALQYAAQLHDENKSFGIEYIRDDKARAAAQLKIEADLWQERIRLAGDGTEAQKILQQQFDTWYQNQSIKPALDANKKLWDGVEQAAHDEFLSLENGARSFADRTKRALDNGLFEWLYQMLAKPWILNLQASMGMGGGGSVTQGITATGGSGTAGNSLIGMANSASSLYKAVSGGAMDSMGSMIAGAGNMFGSSSMSAFGAGFAGNTAGMNMTASEMFSGMGMTSEASAASLGASAGAVAGVLGGIAGGVYGGRMISGGYGSNGAVNTGTAIGAAVGSIVPVIGTALGALIGGLLGGAYNRMFGHKAPEVESQGIRGTFSDDALTGSSYQNILEKGGWFASDKRHTESQALSGDLLKQFTQGFTDLEKVSLGFASSLDVSADALKGYSKTFDITTTGDATKDKQAITDFFTGVSDEIARKLVPNLDDFSKSGETASAALQRLAGDFTSTNQVAQLLGKSAAEMYGSLGIDSAAARERLIDLAGGVSTLSQQAQTYAQNFLTSSERLAPVIKSVDAAMASLGLSSVTTVSAFKGVIDDLVSSGKILTEDGAKEFASLMAINDAFQQAHSKGKTPDQILQERQGLQDQLDQLTMTSAQLLAKQRGALDESNQALFDQIQALQGQKDALQASKDAIQANKDNAISLLGNVDSALSVVQAVAQREKAALQLRIDAETTLINQVKSLSDSLHSALDGMRATGQENADRLAAQAQIKAALAIVRAGGPLPSADSLKQALATVNQNQGEFATYQDYLRDFYSTQNDIAGLAQASDDTLSTEQQTLDTLNAQSKQYDAMLAKAQEQVAELKGQSSTLLSIDQALQGLGTAILSAKENPVVSSAGAINKAYQSSLGRAPNTTDMAYWQNQAASGVPIDTITNAITMSPEATIQGMYQTMLGRTADAAGLQFWLQKLQNGASPADVANAIAGSGEGADYAKLHPFAIGTNYIPEDMPALVHQGERIIPAADNRELMRRLASPSSNGDALAAEVRALRATVAQQAAILERIAGSTKLHADQFDRVSGGGNALVVETI